ncbi:transposase family protein [Streptomyces violaceoruber]|uniref:transposase family protein n=1 Tax=Streptomyces violaceoruber TaxID=1935 RepID=UPI00403C75C5
MHVITDPRTVAVALALPAGPHPRPDRRRTHRIIRICERQGVPIVPELAYQGVGPWLTTGIKRKPLQRLTPTEKTGNRALATARAPFERGVARLKSWRIFRSRCSPNRMPSIAKAILTLERHR